MKRVDTGRDLYDAIEAGEPVIAMWRGLEYDVSSYGPLTLRSGQELRSLDGGHNTAIIKSTRALPDKAVTTEPYEEILRIEPGAKLSNVTLKGLLPEEADAGMIQCGVRILGPGAHLHKVHIDGMLKWGFDVMDNRQHKFTYCSLKNIYYNDPNRPDLGPRGGGYGYGAWLRGTPDGTPTSEADTTVFEQCEFDNLRNGIDCSQPGNSLAIRDSKIRYCHQGGIDCHRTYGFHNLTVSDTHFYCDDVNSQIRIHKLTGKLVIDGCFFRTPVTKVYFNLDELPEMAAWMNREVHETDPEWNSEKVTITNSRFRVVI